MENRIKNYEKFINKKLTSPLTAPERTNLAKLHQETITNFQHERLIHLIITLFFVLVTIIFLIVTTLLTCLYNFKTWLIPAYILTGLLIILTIFYIKHYYFLENHIQKLYDLSPKIYSL